MSKTVIIVPAWSDQAGQCRIVAAEGDIKNALASYRQDQSRWKEVGHMNSQGKVVTLSQELQDAGLLQEMRDCEPLMAGTTFTVSDVALENAHTWAAVLKDPEDVQAAEEIVDQRPRG